jgi:hypothetical protein
MISSLMNLGSLTHIEVDVVEEHRAEEILVLEELTEEVINILDFLLVAASRVNYHRSW